MVNVLIKPRYIVCLGLSATLVACGGEGGSPPTATPSRFLSVQPIQVCDDEGVICAELALFEEATRKIWQQANLVIDFLSPNRLNASRFLTLDNQQEFSELSFSGGTGAFGRHPLSTRTTGPLNMWFVDQIFAADDFVETLGLAWIDQNGIVVSDNLLGFNNGLDRIDTVAHEIGHNLGLTHSNFGAGGSNNLMTDGALRNSPLSVADITPDGANYDQLTASQINFARESPLLADAPNQFPANGAVGEPTPIPAFLEALPDAQAIGSFPHKSLLPASAGVAVLDPMSGLPDPWPPESTALAPVSLASPVAGVRYLPLAPAIDSPTPLTPNFLDLALAQAPTDSDPEPWAQENFSGLEAPVSSQSAVQIPESAPLVQLAIRTDPSLVVRSTPAPQAVPDSSLSWVTALGLGLYLWRQRNR